MDEVDGHIDRHPFRGCLEGKPIGIPTAGVEQLLTRIETVPVKNELVGGAPLIILFKAVIAAAFETPAVGAARFTGWTLTMIRAGRLTVLSVAEPSGSICLGTLLITAAILGYFIIEATASVRVAILATSTVVRLDPTAREAFHLLAEHVIRTVVIDTTGRSNTLT